jgi:hypothetical protein
MFKSITRLVLVATVLAAAIIPSVAAARPDTVLAVRRRAVLS